MVSKLTGTLIEYKDFPSRYVTPRDVEICLPPSYGESGEMRCTVIYMHDGQNLFNSATSTIGIDWGMDEAIVSLCRNGDIPEVIVVGIWCTEMRIREYMPQKALESKAGQQAKQSFMAEQGGEVNSDDYQIQVDQIMRSDGYIEGGDWLTRKFPGTEHSERAWRDRVHIPLTFLLS